MKSKKNISYKYKKKRKIKGGAAAAAAFAKNIGTAGEQKDALQGVLNGAGGQKVALKGVLNGAGGQKDVMKSISNGAGGGSKGKMMEKAANMIGKDNIQNITKAGERYKTMPLLMLVDLIKYTVLTVAGAFIYYPSFLINMPNSTLEEIVPTKEGCKDLFGSELICKTKIKCLIKKCSMFEDPEGFMLKQKSSRVKVNKKGGSKRKRITYKRDKVHTYLKSLPKSMVRKLNKIHKNDVKHAKKYHKNLIKYIKYGGKSLDNKNINMATCKNKHNKVLCSNRPKVLYDLPKNPILGNFRDAVGAMKNFLLIGGSSANSRKKNKKITLFINRRQDIDNDRDENGNDKTDTRIDNDYETAKVQQGELIKSYIKDYLNGESCLKLLISFKVLKTLFIDMKADLKEKKAKEAVDAFASKNNSGIVVPFPFGTSSATTTPEDRINCLIKHLTSVNLNDSEITSDEYNKCFLCKNCTLLGTSIKVWDNLFSSMFTDNRTEFKNYVNFLYSVLKQSKAFEYEETYDDKNDDISDYAYKYYVDTFCSMEKYIDNRIYKGISDTDVKDRVLGIPKMSNFLTEAIEPSMIDILKQIYVTLESLEIEKMLYDVTFDLLYKRILNLREDRDEQRIYLIKRSILDRCKLFWPNKIYSFHIENSIDTDDMKKVNNQSTFTDFTRELIKKLKETDTYSDIVDDP